ncbi:hypothetical protein CQA57_08045, partial [Helicobacter anseris]
MDFTNSNPQSPTGSLNNTSYTIAIGGNVTASYNPILELKSNGKGIDMQGKTLSFLFSRWNNPPSNSGTINTSARKMVLDLSNVNNGTAFKGDIRIVGGRAQKWFGENQFEATFGGDVIGSITSLPYSYMDVNATYTFNNSASLQGNFSASGMVGTTAAQGPQHKLKFVDGTITGKVTASNRADVNITFSPTGSSQSSQTKTWIGGGIASSSKTTVTVTINKNTNGDASENIIKGDITAAGDGFGGATNTITFNTTTKNKIDGNITSSDGFGRTKNIINFAAGDGDINGDISATSTTNEITLTKSDGILAINGGITNNAGTNTIKAENGTIVIKKTGGKISVSGGGTATNTISAKTLTIDIGTIESSGNNNSNNKNVIKGTETVTITGEVKTSVGANNIDGKDITINGSITNMWGNNTINATGAIKIGSQDKKVTISNDSNAATSNAKNTITGGDGSAIYADVKLLKGNDKVSNNITLNGNSSITGDITANAGTNNISIKGTATTSTTPSPSPSTLTTSADMSALKALVGLTGNITTNGGTNNISIKGTATTSTTPSLPSTLTTSGDMSALMALVGLTGNITTNGGTNNIVFENKIWAPSNLTNGASGVLKTSGGFSNLVLRQTVSLSLSNTPIFNVETTGGSANVIMQGPVSVGANVIYGASGTTTLIFAHSNDNQNDAFSASDTAIANNKVLGKTYKDGIKLTLKDKNIKTSDGKNTSFIDTYKSYFIENDTDPILTITTKRSGDASSGYNDIVTIQGIAVGTVSALESTVNSSNGNSTYNITLQNNSVYFGGFDFSKIKDTDAYAKTIINLTMQSGSKFFTDSSVALRSLTIENASLNREETLLNSFEQSNTVIDLGSYGNDNSNIQTRENFNLLMIGDATGSNTGNGLTGSNALFRIYANQEADQSKATLGGIKSSNNGAVNGSGNGVYGNVYADRVVVFNTKDNAQTTQYIQVLTSGSDINVSGISYKGGGTESAGNIAVFTVKNSTGNDTNTALVKLETADAIIGFDQVGSTLKEVLTDQYGQFGTDKTGYTTYFLDAVSAKGASTANQQASAAALGSNYDLYLANMNSLNKRMGELRENA